MGVSLNNLVKIAFVNMNGAWGGAEKVLNNIISTRISSTFQVSAYIGDKGRLFDLLSANNKVNVEHISGESLKDDSSNNVIKNFMAVLANVFILASNAMGYIKKIRQDKPDMVYLNNQQAILIAPLIWAFCDVKKIVGHEHTVQPSKIRQFIYDVIIYLFLDRFITVSNATFSTHFKFARKNMVRVYNGFDFNKELNGDAELNDFASSKECSFLLPAVFRKWKGHAVLIDAARILNEKGYEFRVYLIGDEVLTSETGIKSSLVNAVEINNLQDKVIFLGFKDNVLDYMKRMDVVVQPSTSVDPLPTTVLEALSLGKPVIGSNLGGIPEMIENSYNGYCVEPSNSEQLAIAMESFILGGNNIDIFGERSKKIFDSKFSIDVFENEIVAALHC